MIYQQLKQISLNLRKSRSPLSSTVLFHLSEIQAIGKNSGNRETTEDEAIQYLKKTVQRLKESGFSKQEEIDLLESLLPEMLSIEQMQDFISRCENLSKGDIMKLAKSEFGALVDMKQLSSLVQKGQ